MGKKIKCLLVTTKDDRKFFTYPENFQQLIEFSKTFDADMSVVRTESANLPIMDLDALAPAICSPNYTPPQVGEIEILKSISVEEICNMRLRPRKKKKRKPTREDRVKTAHAIRAHVRETFLGKQTVDIRAVANKWREARLNLVTISNHIRHVRDELVAKGGAIERVGIGQYRMK